MLRATGAWQMSLTIEAHPVMTTERLPTLEDRCRMLLDYSVALFAAGATCIRIETNMGRMAEALGVKDELTIMPRHIHLTLCDMVTGEYITRIATIPHTAINFDVNTRLSSLSWELADGKIDFGQCRARLYDTIRPKPRCKWRLTLLVGVANAAFCRLFGGDPIAMSIVAVATIAGFSVRQALASHGTDTRIIMIVCAFISSILGATDSLFSLGSTPAVAIGTSVLYLVPGIPFLNSFSDMLYRHYICAFSRLMDAIVLTCCISAGLCAGMALMNAGMF